MAQMRKTKFGDVDMDFVLGIGGYDLDRLVMHGNIFWRVLKKKIGFDPELDIYLASLI